MEQLSNPALAPRLGDIAHVSVLWRKVSRLSNCAEAQIGEWLLKCAVERGARHYERAFPASLPPDNRNLTDEELGVALCLGQLPYESTRIRAAAQLLTSPLVDSNRLARLAVMERVEIVLSHIAQAAERVEPDAEPWAFLRQHLPLRQSYSSEILPHWSRFASQTGVTAFGGGPQIKWLRRREITG